MQVIQRYLDQWIFIFQWHRGTWTSGYIMWHRGTWSSVYMPVTQKHMDQRACIYASDIEVQGPVGMHMLQTQSYVDQWARICQWHRATWTNGHTYASDTEVYGPVGMHMPVTQRHMGQWRCQRHRATCTSRAPSWKKRPTQARRKPTGTSASHWIKSFPASNALFTQLQISTPEDLVQLHKWQETSHRALRENRLHFHQIWLKVFFQMSNRMQNQNINKNKKRQVKSHQSKLRC